MVVYESRFVREMDKTAIASGTPSTVLMDRAAYGIYQCATRVLGSVYGKKIVIFSGTGNNGGDGLAFARIAHKEGARIDCFITGDPENMSTDTSINFELLCEDGIVPVCFQPDNASHKTITLEADLIIDTIYGIGFHGTLSGVAAEAAKIINKCKSPVISADIPSGAEADTGLVSENCVQAEYTVTFTCLKPALCIQPAKSYCGEITVYDIGISQSCINLAIEAENSREPQYPIKLIDADFLRGVLPARNPNTHKGDYGKILVIGGRIGFTGAPYLASLSAFRTGSGLVYMAVPESIYEIEAAKCEEIICLPFASSNGGFSASAADSLISLAEKCDVCVLGPGLGLNEDTVLLTQELLKRIDIPIVLDADGINAIAGNINILAERASCRRYTVLTPHDVEFARIGGDLSTGRINGARTMSKQLGAAVVLKGNTTVTALPEGDTLINTSGNPGMAKGGSGDVLAGMIGSLIGQGISIEMAAVAGVYFHGAAGDFAAERYGEYGMLPTDLIDEIPSALRKFVSTFASERCDSQ